MFRPVVKKIKRRELASCVTVCVCVICLCVSAFPPYLSLPVSSNQRSLNQPTQATVRKSWCCEFSYIARTQIIMQTHNVAYLNLANCDFRPGFSNLEKRSPEFACKFKCLPPHVTLNCDLHREPCCCWTKECSCPLEWNNKHCGIGPIGWFYFPVACSERLCIMFPSRTAYEHCSIFHKYFTFPVIVLTLHYHLTTPTQYIGPLLLLLFYNKRPGGQMANLQVHNAIAV